MTKHLPVVGSSAKFTSFCMEPLDGPDGLRLWLDGNGKITAGNGTVDAPRANALSTVAVEDCPGSTPTCRRACYVENLEDAQPGMARAYRHNSATLRRILGGSRALQWADHLGAWVAEHAAGGFRWHVSGDVFDRNHAEWIARACRASPGVRHWIYTRSFDLLGPLVEVSTQRGGNLALNLSADADNWLAAVAAAEKYDLRICYLTADGSLPYLRPGDVVFPDYALRPRQFKTFAESPWWQGISQEQRRMVCPVDALGKSEAVRCGLERCRKCLE